MRDKQLYINGERLEEQYVIHRDARIFTRPYPRDNWGPLTIPPGQYFMLGDNRDQSADSRFWGLLPGRLIEGKAWLVYWPVGRWRIIR